MASGYAVGRGSPAACGRDAGSRGVVPGQDSEDRDDSVLPVEAAGLLDLVDVPPEGTELAPGLRLLPTPGHTPGHIAVRLTGADGEKALITGDCVHHPVQFARPAIGSCVDIDPERAERSRRELLASAADADTLVLGTHFPPPTAGRVIVEGGGYRLLPVAPSA